MTETDKRRDDGWRKEHSGHEAILSPGYGGKPDPSDLYLRSTRVSDHFQQPNATRTPTHLILIRRYMSPESGITRQGTMPSRWCLV